MIATLSGTVSEVRIMSLVIENSGIGYEVFVPTNELAAAKLRSALNFHIYEHIREDSHDLYGFIKVADKQMFEQLLSVNGVGPKVALAIISGVENLGDVIRSGNTAALQSVSGVGKRVAERIIVDLRNKLGETADSIGGETAKPVYEALTQLGYRSAQAHDVVAKLPSDLKTDEERIKWALRELGK